MPANFSQHVVQSGQGQAAGQFADGVGMHLLSLGNGLVHGGHDEVFEQLAVVLVKTCKQYDELR